MNIRSYSALHSKVPGPRAGGIIQTFGIDARAAALVVLAYFFAFGGDIATMGALYIVELIAAVKLTFVTYKIQRAWYGDHQNAALIRRL